MITRFSELPEEHKIYTLKTFTGEQFFVNGLTKARIMRTSAPYIELEDGDGSTRRDKNIAGFFFNAAETKNRVQDLPIPQLQAFNDDAK